MFENIGGKIKTLAVIVCVLGIVASFAGAVNLWMANSRYNPTIVPGVVTLVAGCLISWVGSFFTYGFGQLIENSDRMVERLERLEACSRDPEAKAAPAPSAPVSYAPVNRRKAAEAEWKCGKCGTVNKETAIFCRDCGEYR